MFNENVIVLIAFTILGALVFTLVSVIGAISHLGPDADTQRILMEIQNSQQMIVDAIKQYNR